MGRPGKVLRPVKDTDLAWVTEAGRLYVEYGRTFMSDAVRVL
jgi:hypothetical protein